MARKMPITAEQGPGQILMFVGKRQVGSIEMRDDYGNLLMPEDPLAKVLIEAINASGADLRAAMEG